MAAFAPFAPLAGALGAAPAAGALDAAAGSGATTGAVGADGLAAAGAREGSVADVIGAPGAGPAVAELPEERSSNAPPAPRANSATSPRIA